MGGSVHLLCRTRYCSYTRRMALLDAHVHHRWVLSVLLLLILGAVVYSHTNRDAYWIGAAAAGVLVGAVVAIETKFSRKWIATAVAGLLVATLFVRT